MCVCVCVCVCTCMHMCVWSLEMGQVFLLMGIRKMFCSGEYSYVGAVGTDAADKMSQQMHDGVMLV